MGCGGSNWSTTVRITSLIVVCHEDDGADL